jgi:hypothetical protein
MKMIPPWREHKDPHSKKMQPHTCTLNTIKKKKKEKSHQRSLRKLGRRTNKEVREEAATKEKAQGKQQTIEHTIYTSTRKAGTRGMEHSAYDNRAPSTTL